MLTETSPTRRDERKRATRAALIDAARAVLSERGLEGATTRAITDRTGVSAGTFFVHFADTHTLVDVLLDDHLTAALERGRRTTRSDASIVDQLVHMATTLFTAYGREPQLSKAFLEASLFRVEPTGIGERRLLDFRTWVTGRIETAVDRGEVPSADAQLVFEAYFSVYFSLLVGGLRGDFDRRRQEAILRAVLTALLDNGQPHG